jgi:Zinc finger, C3HC4 type (RING finger)/SPRY domain
LIGIGVGGSDVPHGQYPGWTVGSIGYHLDDGGVFVQSGSPIRRYVRGETGDLFVLDIDFDLITNKAMNFIVHRNGEEVMRWTIPPRMQTMQLFGLISLGHSDESEEIPRVRVEWGDSISSLAPNGLPGECKSGAPAPEFLLMGLRRDDGVFVRAPMPEDDVGFGYMRSRTPLTPDNSSFTMEVVDADTAAVIGLGIISGQHPEIAFPGWVRYSFGYHLDDGGFFAERASKAAERYSRGRTGDIFEFGVDFAPDGRITHVFTKRNHIVLFHIPLPVHVRRIRKPFYAAVAMGDPGNPRHNPRIRVHMGPATAAQLGDLSNANSPMVPFDDQKNPALSMAVPDSRARVPMRLAGVDYDPAGVGTSYFPARNLANNLGHHFSGVHVTVTIDGVWSYIARVGQAGTIRGASALTRDNHCFSIRIEDKAHDALIGIGIGPQSYPLSDYPGWSKGSVGYHMDDGAIFMEQGTSTYRRGVGETGDVIECGIEFGADRDESNSLYFKRNGRVIHQALAPHSDLDDFFPIICLGHGDFPLYPREPRIRALYGPGTIFDAAQFQSGFKALSYHTEPSLVSPHSVHSSIPSPQSMIPPTSVSVVLGVASDSDDDDDDENDDSDSGDINDDGKSVVSSDAGAHNAPHEWSLHNPSHHTSGHRSGQNLRNISVDTSDDGVDEEILDMYKHTLEAMLQSGKPHDVKQRLIHQLQQRFNISDALHAGIVMQLSTEPNLSGVKPGDVVSSSSSSAVAAAAAGVVPADAPRLGRQTSGEDDRECVVCLDAKSDHIILPCMHLCLCIECAPLLQQAAHARCPKCRQDVGEVRKVY